ncbi:MAG: hypothetical protein M1836_000079 [Candelina mexicana]|nr:MAG: hypothetical protein M1836_000079 [Candelina mexicana]
MDISGHRKIELQSPLDLTYLQSNISRSARAKLDLNLPPLQSSDEDKLRTKVEELVDENIIINGLDASSSSILDASTQNAHHQQQQQQTSEIEEFEPYDSRLATRVQTLYSTLESETLRLTQLRRSAPATAASNFKTAFTSSLDEDSRCAEQWMAQAAAREGDGMEGRVRLERGEEVRGMYERGVAGLVREKGAMTETAARLERARAAVGEIEGRGLRVGDGV